MIVTAYLFGIFAAVAIIHLLHRIESNTRPPRWHARQSDEDRKIIERINRDMGK